MKTPTKEKKCCICLSSKTEIMVRKGKPCFHWYLLDGKPLCKKCYFRNNTTKKNGYKIAHKLGQRRYTEDNPNKIKAQRMTNNKGLRLNHCEKCGIKDVRLEGHHFDYSQPDKIVTLCVKCHKEVHRK
jgi:hypothetical protein